MPSPEYYHRQADLCLRMALLTSEYEERLRLLDIANGYRDDAVRVEALQGASPVDVSCPGRLGRYVRHKLTALWSVGGPI